jgi:hypothetical protein
MRYYDFYLYNGGYNGGGSDHLGGLDLPHDDAAVAFAKQVLRDLTGNQFARSSMHIIERDRIVEAIPFTARMVR